MKRTPVLARGFVHSALLALSCAAVLASGSAVAQMGGGGAMKAMLQQKLEAIKTSSAENQQKLHQYTWTETSSITANGREMPPKVSNCFYGPDGKVHKTPIGDAQETSAGGGRGGPLGKGGRSEGPHGLSGSEMTLDGEGIVDCGVG